MLYRKEQRIRQTDETGGKNLPMQTTGQPADTSGDEMPDWVNDPKKAYAEIQKLRKENADYRTQRNKERDETELFKKSLLETLDARLPKQVDSPEEPDPIKAMETRLAAFEARQKTADETVAKERLQALKERIAVEFFGEKIAGDNKAQTLAAMAARLSGSDEASLREDAKALAALIPNPQWKNDTTPASPGGQPVTETDSQRIQRIRKGGEAKTSFG